MCLILDHPRLGSKGHKRTFRDILRISRTIPPIHDAPTANRRLDSWKEIAAFFDRDERTVKRWEKERSLPVHRLPGGSRARVFAFSDELSRWMHSLDSSTGELILINSDSIADDLPVPSSPQALNTDTAQWPSNQAAVPPGRSKQSWIAALTLALLVAVVVIALVIVYRRHSVAPAVNSGPTSISSSAKAPAPRVNPEAEELYLKGRYYWTKRTPADLTKAVDFFTQSIVRDPNYAPAYVGLADCYNLLREFSAMPAAEAFPRAFAAAKKAVELDDSSAEAHASLAFVMFYWNWSVTGAESEFRRAIELNPDYALAHHWYATFLMVLGRSPEALQEINRAQKLDPASTPILADKGLILFHAGQPDQSIALLKQIETAQPAFFSTHKYLSYIYLVQQDYPNYLAQAMQAALLSHDEQELAIVRAAEQGFKSGGEREMLSDILREQKKFYDQKQLSAFLVASTCARLGQKEEALQYLQASYEQHDPLFLTIRTEQAFSTLYADPAFRKLVVQAGLPPLP
jgi:tetratricopeptide (TPR) repeat protein